MPLNPAPLNRQLWGKPRQSEHPFPWKLKFLTQFLHHRSEFTNLMKPKDMGWTCFTLINAQKKDVATYNKKWSNFGDILHIQSTPCSNLWPIWFLHSRKCPLRTQCKIEFTYQSQNPYESKSGKNGSKHPMLSISMAFNVISCKKSKETLKNSKSLILQCKFGSRAQKWPKIAKKTDH